MNITHITYFADFMFDIHFIYIYYINIACTSALVSELVIVPMGDRRTADGCRRSRSWGILGTSSLFFRSSSNEEAISDCCSTVDGGSRRC